MKFKNTLSLLNSFCIFFDVAFLVKHFTFFSQVVELKPGGRDIPVTNSNRISYIHLVADYRLNKQVSLIPTRQ